MIDIQMSTRGPTVSSVQKGLGMCQCRGVDEQILAGGSVAGVIMFAREVRSLLASIGGEDGK